MRILHVINDTGVGGAQTLIELLARNRGAADQVEVAVLLPPGVFADRFAAAFDEVHYLGMSKRRPNPIAALRRLQKIVDGFRPDVIHSHLAQSDLLALGIRRGGAALVSTGHTSGYSSRDHLATRAVAKTVALLEGRVDALIASHESSEQHMRSIGYRKPIDVVRNGAELPPLEQWTDRPNTFLSLSRWHPMKGHAILFAAFGLVVDRHPDWTLVCAGSDVDPSNTELNRLLLEIAPAARERIRLVGPVADVAPLLDESGALIISSTYGETFPLVGSESAGRGVPVISTDVGGAASFVVEPALVAEPGSVEDLARAMTHFAELGTDDRRQLGERSRALAAREFSITATAERYRAVYVRAIERRRSSASRSALSTESAGAAR